MKTSVILTRSILELQTRATRMRSYFQLLTERTQVKNLRFYRLAITVIEILHLPLPLQIVLQGQCSHPRGQLPNLLDNLKLRTSNSHNGQVPLFRDGQIRNHTKDLLAMLTTPPKMQQQITERIRHLPRIEPRPRSRSVSTQPDRSKSCRKMPPRTQPSSPYRAPRLSIPI